MCLLAGSLCAVGLCFLKSKCRRNLAPVKWFQKGVTSVNPLLTFCCYCNKVVLKIMKKPRHKDLTVSRSNLKESGFMSCLTYLKEQSPFLLMKLNAFSLYIFVFSFFVVYMEGYLHRRVFFCAVKVLSILLENRRNLWKDGMYSRLQKKLFRRGCEFSEPTCT